MINRAHKLLTVSFLLLVAFVHESDFARQKLSGEAKQQAPAARPRVTDPRLHTIQFDSKLIGKRLPYNVLLPRDYDNPAAKDKHYPVLCLLHGLFGHYDNWANLTRLVDYSANYDVIIVMPEGNDSWYTDSATVPSDKYETYIVAELIPDVQRRFRAIDNRNGRAIAGLSMGGYGALKFGIKYPQLFGFVASISGALGAPSYTRSDLQRSEDIWLTLPPVFGADNSATRNANDLNKLLSEVPASRVSELPFIYLDCGTEDPFFPASKSFSELLLSRKIPHEYRERPGNHSWTYWGTQVQEVLRLAEKQFHAPPVSAKPTS